LVLPEQGLESVIYHTNHYTIYVVQTITQEALWAEWKLTSCNLVTNSLSPPRQSLALNQESKSSAELNTSGNRKFNKAHNSCKLFCRGVPVSRSLFADLNSRTISDNCKKKRFSNWKCCTKYISWQSYLSAHVHANITKSFDKVF
jgi:hypothetical protein